MGTNVYLSNDPSDVSGYLKAYIGSRSPNCSSSYTTAVTGTVDSATLAVQMTLTSGGTVAKWMTAPLKTAVSISTMPFVNVWGVESNAAANAQLNIQLAQYTTSLQSAFLSTSSNVELTTSNARVFFVGGGGTPAESITTTAFAIGDRLAILPYVIPKGTEASTYLVTMPFNAYGDGAIGDTYVALNENIEAGQSQFGDGDTSALPGGPGAQAYETLRLNLTPLTCSNGLFTNSARLTDVLNELGYQRDNQTA